MIMFNSIDEALKYIEKQIPISLEKIGNQVKEILTENIEQLWYGRPFEPQYYDRTMDYINSLRCSSATRMGNGQYQIKIYFSTHDIKPRITEEGKWNQHAGVNYEDVSVDIPRYIEEGNKSSLYSYEGVHPVEITKKNIEDTDFLKTRMIELLGNYGFDCNVI